METNLWIFENFKEIIGGIVGVILIIKGIKQHLVNNYLQENGRETVGIITNFKKEYINDSEHYEGDIIVYYPIATYQDKEGNEYVYQFSEGYNENLYRTKIGEQVNLIYNENRPHRAKEISVVEWNMLNLILLFLGFCIFFYSLLEIFG